MAAHHVLERAPGLAEVNVGLCSDFVEYGKEVVLVSRLLALTTLAETIAPVGQLAVDIALPMNLAEGQHQHVVKQMALAERSVAIARVRIRPQAVRLAGFERASQPLPQQDSSSF